MFELKFHVALAAKINGGDNIEFPVFEDDRQAFIDWLTSEPPMEAMRSTDEAVVYAALFPDNRLGLSTEHLDDSNATAADRMAVRFAEAEQKLR